MTVCALFKHVIIFLQQHTPKCFIALTLQELQANDLFIH